jgi:lysophospholipid acyltransferase (LPLAT)-like uncharacterized protein
MQLRVDDIPWYLTLPFLIYGYGAGLLWITCFCVASLTCGITIKNKKVLDRHPNAIVCLWHENDIAFFVVQFFQRFKKHAWLNRPDAYMKPIHVVIKFLGVEKIILGSSGREGRSAANILLAHLNKGYSTMLNPDGPYGPKHVCKKGVFQLSQKSGVPIVPVSFKFKRCLKLPGWDSKDCDDL